MDTIEFIDHVILIADKFVKKVETGRARSRETYNDMRKIKGEAEGLKRRLKKKGNNERL